MKIDHPIIIEPQKDGLGFKVSYGEQWEDLLTCNETLGTVAAVLYSGKPGYMKDRAGHEAFAKVCPSSPIGSPTRIHPIAADTTKYHVMFADSSELLTPAEMTQRLLNQSTTMVGLFKQVDELNERVRVLRSVLAQVREAVNS